MHPILEPREDVSIYLDFDLVGPMVDAEFGADMVAILKEAGLDVASAKDQEVCTLGDTPSFFMSVRVDRTVEALIEAVRKKVPRGVLLDFQLTMDWLCHDGRIDAQTVPINAEPMAGLL